MFPDPPIISTEEVQAAVRLGKNGKAAGEDGITYEHIASAGASAGEIGLNACETFLLPCLSIPMHRMIFKEALP